MFLLIVKLSTKNYYLPPPVGWFVPALLYIWALVAVGEPCLGNLDIIKLIKILEQNIFFL
jgi:hypothetical protein